MNGVIAQVVALVTHGSAYLASRSASPPELLDANSTFRYVRSLRFVRRRRRLGLVPADREVGSTTAAWFADLRARGADRLEIVRVRRPEPLLAAHASVALVGGETCGAVARIAGERERWVGEWEVGEAPDQRIWTVTYRSGRGGREAPPAGVAELAAELEARLSAAEAFAADADLPSWGARFGDARRRLVEPMPAIEYHPDMVPPAFGPLAARQLLAAAARAWVFGGMGSWNDLWFEDRALGARYQALTPALFEAVMAGIIGGTNAGSSG